MQKVISGMKFHVECCREFEKPLFLVAEMAPHWKFLPITPVFLKPFINYVRVFSLGGEEVKAILT